MAERDGDDDGDHGLALLVDRVADDRLARALVDAFCWVGFATTSRPLFGLVTKCCGNWPGSLSHCTVFSPYPDGYALTGRRVSDEGAHDRVCV